MARAHSALNLCVGGAGTQIMALPRNLKFSENKINEFKALDGFRNNLNELHIFQVQ